MEASTLLNFLHQREIIDAVQKEDLNEEHRRSGKPIVDIIADFSIMTASELYQTIATEIGSEMVDLNACKFTPELMSIMPSQTARIQGALPVYFADGTLYVALVNPLDGQAAESIRFATGRNVQVLVAPSEEVQDLIDRFYVTAHAEVEDLISALSGVVDITQLGAESEKLTLEAATAAPIIKYVNSVLTQAIKARASDIHFEPFETEFKIRYRVDGALYEMAPPPKDLAVPIVSRIKVISNLNIAEKRLPQDGRIQTVLGGKPIDLRVSTLPTQFGESVVLRVLDRSAVNLDLEALNIPPDIYKYICQVIQKPNGIFIVTGPTGSGKTTTLYSCLRRINTIDTKILTVEDPVEYELEGIMQVAAHESIGLDFARALRAFLRQDPDKIMVGETRDLETAQIAIQASLTGHLVLTTLHTNDAPGAITRLIDMGVEPFLIASSVEGVLAQRLVRKICVECKTSYEPSEMLLKQIGLTQYEIGDKSFYYGRGCDICNLDRFQGEERGSMSCWMSPNRSAS